MSTVTQDFRTTSTPASRAARAANGVMAGYIRSLATEREPQVTQKSERSRRVLNAVRNNARAARERRGACGGFQARQLVADLA